MQTRVGGNVGQGCLPNRSQDPNLHCDSKTSAFGQQLFLACEQSIATTSQTFPNIMHYGNIMYHHNFLQSSKSKCRRRHSTAIKKIWHWSRQASLRTHSHKAETQHKTSTNKIKKKTVFSKPSSQNK